MYLVARLCSLSRALIYFNRNGLQTGEALRRKLSVGRSSFMW